ncbi:pyrroline-5-carboxylate reductase [Candidatus Woesearchaeota archaeon]|nr:pyrroline-5-carboxylate reductase [Candidatus Woesearchaeota archaeon]
MTKPISFIGTGKMAAALISCIYKNNLAKSVIASDHREENLRNIKSKFKRIRTTTDNKEAVRNSDIVFICVKPQDIDVVLKEIKGEIKNQLIVSIAAGIKIRHIESVLGKKRIIRVMPNINSLVGEMAAGFSAGKYATKDDVNEVKKLLNSAGISFFIKEELIDALSSISGSGPAFFAYFMEAMAKAGMKNGLPKETAYKLAAKTALGTGKLLIEKNLSPDELIKMVASKKGVTLAGLKVLDKNKTSKIIEKTINAAIKRSKELGK